MDYKKRCLRETKKFLKNNYDTMYSAFCMGFDDAAQGKEQHDPPQTDPEDGLTNAALSLAHELYKRGYNAGRGDENESALLQRSIGKP